MNPTVRYPVYDLNNRLLVAAGTELTPAFMADLIQKNTTKYEQVPMLEYGSIRDDLMRQFTIPPYDVIFSREDAMTTVLGVLEQVRLIRPLLEAMDYFRTNDFHTYQHMLIISALATLILHDLAPRYVSGDRNLHHLGPSHDLGKVSVPIPVLLKKSPLTRAELDLVRHHAVAGYVMLSHYLRDADNLACLIALDHHERLNGSGYPRGIRQDNLVVAVTTVCDIYDALVAQRPYRPVSFDNRTAIEELTWMADRGEINMEAVQVLVAYNRRMTPDISRVQVSREHRGKPPAQNMYGVILEDTGSVTKV